MKHHSKLLYFPLCLAYVVSVSYFWLHFTKHEDHVSAFQSFREEFSVLCDDDTQRKMPLLLLCNVDVSLPNGISEFLRTLNAILPKPGVHYVFILNSLLSIDIPSNPKVSVLQANASFDKKLWKHALLHTQFSDYELFAFISSKAPKMCSLTTLLELLPRSKFSPLQISSLTPDCMNESFPLNFEFAWVATRNALNLLRDVHFFDCPSKVCRNDYFDQFVVREQLHLSKMFGSCAPLCLTSIQGALQPVQNQLRSRLSKMENLSSKPSTTLQLVFFLPHFDLNETSFGIFNIISLLLDQGHVIRIVSLPNDHLKIWDRVGLKVSLCANHLKECLSSAPVDVIFFQSLSSSAAIESFVQLRQSVALFSSIKILWLVTSSEAAQEQLQSSISLLRVVDRVIFFSYAARARFSAWDYGNFLTIHNFVDLERIGLFANRFSRSQLRHCLGVDLNDFLIAYIELHHPLKHSEKYQLLVDASQQLKDFPRRSHVMVIDAKNFTVSGSLFTSGDISFDNTEIWHQLIAADVTVCFVEGVVFPDILLAAMSLGKVLVLNRNEVTLEHLSDESQGILLRSDNKSALVNELSLSLARVLQSKFQAKQIGRCVREAVMQKFSKSKAKIVFRAPLVNLLQSPAKQDFFGKVCIVVRTYWGHIGSVFNLKAMLISLIKQYYTNWEAILLVTDLQPFSELFSLLSNLGDDRLRPLFLPNATAYSMGKSAYFETDEAIAHCSPSAVWFLVTNGDNEYSPEALSHLDLEYDVISMDFYSRHTQPLDSRFFGSGCVRWRHSSCKRNTARLYYSDLGANIVSLTKWRCENRKFHKLPSDGCQDGHMMESLAAWRWRVKHVYQCLLDHNPNPHSCAAKGLWWIEDSKSCVDASTAKDLLKEQAFVLHNISSPDGVLLCLQRNS